MFNPFEKPLDLSEFVELKHLLDEDGIEYEEQTRNGGMQLCIPDIESFSTVHNNENRSISVICTPYSYGGSLGLLEVYAPGLNTGVEGYLSASEMIEYVKDTLNGISRGSCG